MKKIILLSFNTFLVFSFFLGGINLSSKINAQSTAVENNVEDRPIRFQGVPSAPGEGAPTGRRKGAGTHSGECEVEDPQKTLTALVPPNNIAPLWGKTAGESPTLWFYVPYPPNGYVLLDLQDEQGNSLYGDEIQIQLQETPGIISITLPQPEMFKKGGKYLWYLYIYCGDSSSPENYVSGEIEVGNINPELEQKLQQSNPLERVYLYAENGFWFNALTALNQVSDSGKADNLLANLLEQVELSGITP